MKVRELVTTLSFESDTRGLKANSRAMFKFTKDTIKGADLMQGSMGRSFSGIVKAGMAAFNSLGRGFNQLKSTVGKGISATFKMHGIGDAQKQAMGLHTKLMAVAAMATGGIGAAGAAKSTFSAAGEFEMQMARLTTIFGQKMAPEIYDQMQQFAARTPFEMPDIVDFVASTQGAGFNFLDKSGKLNMAELAAIGDQVAASGKKLPEMAAAMISAQRGLPNMLDNFVGLAGKVEDGGITTSMFDRKTGKQIKGRIEEDDPNRAAAIQDFFVRGGRREGIVGGMERMSQTLPGKLSTLRDAVKNLQVQFYMGFQGNAHKFLDSIAKTVTKLTPDMKRLGVNVGDFLSHDLPGYLEKTRKVLPFVVGSLGLMYAHMVGIASMNFAAKIYAISKALNVMGISGMIVNGVIAFIPMLIGLAVLAVGTLAADFIYFCTTGESYLLDFTEKWPGLHDKIRDTYYLVKEVSLQVIQGFKSMGELMGLYLPPIIDGLKLGFHRMFAPVRVMLDIIVGLWKAVGDGIDGATVGLKNFMVWIDKYFPMIKKAGEIFDRFMWGSTGMPDPYAGQRPTEGVDAATVGRGVANPIATDLVKNARTVRDTAGYCLRAVGKMHNMTFGASANHLATRHAADAADIIARSDKFTEIKVTKEMLNDPKYMQLLHGATAIYNRQAGFSSVSGHAEVFDMVNKTANFGRGGVPLSQRSEHMLKNARYFVPVQNINQTATPSPTRAPAGGNQAVVNLNQNFNGPANPAQVGRAATNGLQQGFTLSGFGLTER